MSKNVKVHIFDIKDENGVSGMVELKVPITPWNRKSKKRQRAFSDGVAAGVAAMMQHFQPRPEPKVE